MMQDLLENPEKDVFGTFWSSQAYKCASVAVAVSKIWGLAVCGGGSQQPSGCMVNPPTLLIRPRYVGHHSRVCFRRFDGHAPVWRRIAGGACAVAVKPPHEL
jgi:hypothetical protein